MSNRSNNSTDFLACTFNYCDKTPSFDHAREIYWGVVVSLKSCLSERVKCVEDPLDRGKNHNPKKSLGLPTKPPKTPGPKINPQKIPCRMSKP